MIEAVLALLTIIYWFLSIPIAFFTVVALIVVLWGLPLCIVCGGLGAITKSEKVMGVSMGILFIPWSIYWVYPLVYIVEHCKFLEHLLEMDNLVAIYLM